MGDLTAMMRDDDFFLGAPKPIPKERTSTKTEDVQREVICEILIGEDLSRFNYLNMEEIPDYKAIDAANGDLNPKKAKTISCMRCSKKFSQVHELLQHYYETAHRSYKEPPPFTMWLRNRDEPPPPLEPGPIRCTNPASIMKPSFKPYNKPSRYGSTGTSN